MNNRACLIVLVVAVIYVSGAGAQQYPILDAVANRIVQKYQNASCEELYQERSQKKQPTEQEQKVIQMLRSDPQMRAEFIGRVAAPIANKMFECGMIP